MVGADEGGVELQGERQNRHDLDPARRVGEPELGQRQAEPARRQPGEAAGDQERQQHADQAGRHGPEDQAEAEPGEPAADEGAGHDIARDQPGGRDPGGAQAQAMQQGAEQHAADQIAGRHPPMLAQGAGRAGREQPGEQRQPAAGRRVVRRRGERARLRIERGQERGQQGREHHQPHQLGDRDARAVGAAAAGQEHDIGERARHGAQAGGRRIPAMGALQIGLLRQRREQHREGEEGEAQRPQAQGGQRFRRDARPHGVAQRHEGQAAQPERHLELEPGEQRGRRDRHDRA